MSRHYGNPPIAEALCEFQFVSDKPWDWTIPGLIYPKICDRFPIKQQEQAFELTVAPQQQLVQKFSTALSKMQFMTNEKTSIVQVGPDLLGVNALKPYPGWPEFFKLISEQFATYTEVAEPKGFKRIGVRYINRIEFQSRGIETTDYFEYYPHLPQRIEQKHGPFTMRVVHPSDDDRDVLIINLANILPSENLAYVLDLDYSLVQSDKVTLDDGLRWVEQAHANIEDMFEACITNKLRTLFEEKP